MYQAPGFCFLRIKGYEGTFSQRRELELELIQSHIAQKPVLRDEVDARGEMGAYRSLC